MYRKGNSKKLISLFLSFFMIISLGIVRPIKASAATITSDANNGVWSSKDVKLINTPEAQLMVRSGDIDNFGFEWSSGFNPFSGANTAVHSYPWATSSGEPSGLDRIMVVSGYDYGYNRKASDGYTSSTTRNTNQVQSIQLDYLNELAGINIRSAVLQLFVDDFQPKNSNGVSPKGISGGNNHYTTRISATVNGQVHEESVPEIDNIINNLDQSGPIGKLITVQIPDRLLYLVKSGSISLKIDDARNGITGDGYAIDFVKLLINFKSFANTATVEGYVKDNNNNKLQGATVTAGGVVTTTTNANGVYKLEGVPAGQAIITATKPGYMSQSITIPQVVAGGGYTNINFTLTGIAKLGTPTFTQNPLNTVITNNDVSVTIDYPSNPTIKEYKIGESGLWQSYIGPIAISENTVITARGKAVYENYENVSDIASHSVTNIDKISPPITITTPVMGDDKISVEEQKNVIIRGTTEPNAKVTVVITDENNKSVNNSVAVIGDNSNNYTVNNLDVSGLSAGGLTVTATAQDAAGNSSQATTEIQKNGIIPEVNISVRDVNGIRDTYAATSQNLNKSVNKILNPNIILKGDSFADINVKGSDVDFFKYQFVASTAVPAQMPVGGWKDIDLTGETINDDVVLEQVGHLNQRAYDVSHMPLLTGTAQWSNAELVFKNPFDATTYKSSTYSQSSSEYGNYEDYLKGDGTKVRRWVTNSIFMKNMNIGGTYKEASKFWGYIKVPKEGDYKFAANSDDGCRGYITADGETKPFVDMFQPQGTNFGTTNNVYHLKSDKFYPIYLEYFNWGGEANFELKYSDNGSITTNSSKIPAAWFYPSKNITPGEYATTTFTGSEGVKFPEESNDYYIAYKTGKGNNITREGFYGPFNVDGKTKLSLSKAVVGGNKVGTNEDFKLEYTIQAEDVVPISTFKNVDGTFKEKIYLNSVKLQDEYPENIDIKSIANGSAIVKNDQRITAIIPDIEYKLTTKNGKAIYSAQPVKIEITLSAKIVGKYTLSEIGKSIITFGDLNGANAQMEFEPIYVDVINVDKSTIRTGLFLNNRFSEKSNISIVKGFNTNLAVEIKNLNNQKVKLEIENNGFITTSNVLVYASTDLKNPIRSTAVTGNTITIENLPSSNDTYIFVLKVKAVNITTDTINSKIMIGDLIKDEKHSINVVKLPILQ